MAVNNRNLQKIDDNHIWRPFTQESERKDQYLPTAVKAKGVWITDNKGKRYLDAIASWWVTALGHNPTPVTQAIAKQAKAMSHVIFANFAHEGASELAGALLPLLPSNMKRIFFSDDGSTAVEVALKMAVQYQAQTGSPEKSKILALSNAYHGDTLGAMSVSGTGHYFGPYKSMTFDSPKLDDLDQLESFFKKHGPTAAAFIVEPLLQAAGGMIIYSPKYLRAMAKICRRYGVLFIFDEVATGFGRTGKMFALEHAKIRPDFVCLSKGITGGTMAMGLTITTNKVFQAFNAPYHKDKTFFHGHSYTANPIACAAACACLKIFREKDIIKQSQKQLAHFTQHAESLAKHPALSNFRQLGFVAAYDMTDNRPKNKRKQRLGPWLTQEALKQGVFIRPLGNILYFWPAITITRKEIDFMFDGVQTILNTMGKQLTKK